MPTRGLVAIFASVTGVAMLVAIVVHCRHEASVTPPVATVTVALDPEVAVDAKVAVDAGPPPNSEFVGSAKCGTCHEKELAAWKKSWHARALAPASGHSVVGDFSNAHFTGTSSEAWMQHTGDKRTMRAKGPAGTPQDFPVDWVIGGKRMQDNVTVFPDGRWQVLPVYFHVTGRAWVDYTEAKQGALTPEHPFYWTNARRMANHECLDCHTTNLRVDYDEATRQWTTTFTDADVACEDCHGPGAKHSATKAAIDIVHPIDSGEVGLSACARCHGPRKPLWPLLDAEHPFKLGQPYDEVYDPIVVVLPDGGMSSDFFADGKPSTSSFEYQAMLQSACFRKGGATCVYCHTAPHEPHRTAELRNTSTNEICRGCHDKVAAAGSTHSHHRAAAAQQCVACHMPPIVSGVLDHFADHAIDVPAPSNTVRHNVPNACGVCHADKSAADLARSLATWWPGAAKRQHRRERLADAFDEATAKDSAHALLDVIADPDEAPTLRGAAAIVLARRFGAQTAPKLQPLLDNRNVILRAKGCEALGAARAIAAADAVAARLVDSSLRVRLAAALALFDMHDPRGEPALKALADSPETSHLMVPHLEIGTMMGKRGDFAGARRELTWVARLTPYYTDALVDLAAIDAELGDFAEARHRIDQVLQLEPAHRGALALRARLPDP
jgi:predicted CXXCH cytochrome family protein